MAINYLGKVGESTTTGDPKVIAVGLAVPANSLVIMALSCRRTTVPGVTSVTDSAGHTYTKQTVAGSACLAGHAWKRLTSPLTTSHTITVDWNGTLTESWVSIHAFEHASGSGHDGVASASNDASPSVVLDVPGSDWLTFAVFYWPNGFPTVTPINSSISRDTGSKSECFSRNGTVGTTHEIGGTTTFSGTHYYSAMSYAFESSGTGNIRGQKTLIGV